ncbi:MAG TPA: spore coat protein U domain-containing protein [Burkholderiales bacterium]|nr:spore coat protein U domain-containing protein [Burkholderiales bacterium]
MRLVAAIFALVALPASAAVTCTSTVTAITVVYDPTSPTTNVTTGSYSISCTRALTDPNTFAWQLGVNNGLHAGGGFNRAQLAGAQRYNYETYRTSPYVAGNIWGDTAATRFTGTLSFGAALTASTSGAFDIVLLGSQTVQPAGTYTDTLTATLRNGAGTSIGTTTFGVTVLTTNTCQLSVAPGNINFTYTSFQASAAAASSSFGVRCTTALPYTMALDATSGTLLGLTYTLALSASSGTGSGATQTYNINGSIAGNQSGTCGTGVCTGSQTRTLTLTW